MAGYGTPEVVTRLGLTPSQVRGYVRAGFLAPARGPRGAFRFSFQDLLVLRTAFGLLAARVPARRVKRALRRLREQLGEGRPLSGVHITAEGDEVVVRDGHTRWEPVSGQVLFDFGVSEVADKVAPLLAQAAAATGGALSAEDWYAWGCDLEEAAPEQAREAYRRALELEPDHAGALVNLGRLLHEAGAPGVAEAHYRRVLQAHPDDETALFNLGVVLEDVGRAREAIEAYERALSHDAALADAHFNAARLHEALGHKAEALRHLKSYRKLTRG
jgi:tetratricopeptide (TPR) repeat protein